jgi:hypothetical protein
VKDGQDSNLIRLDALQLAVREAPDYSAPHPLEDALLHFWERPDSIQDFLDPLGEFLAAIGLPLLVPVLGLIDFGAGSAAETDGKAHCWELPGILS